MATAQGIWEALIAAAPAYGMDVEYLQSQAQALDLGDSRLEQLWEVCEHYPIAVMDLFAAFEHGVANRADIEQVIAGDMPIERIRLFLAEFQQADDLFDLTPA